MRDIKKCLESESLQVVTVDSGLEAMKLMKANKFDFVFSDLNLHASSGYGLVENMRNSEEARSIPFFMYSSRPISESNESLALEVGANGCLKSTDPIAIKNEIMELIETK